MKIGDLCINGVCALAPMAGAADLIFRDLCASFGAAFTVSEMVSAKALTMGDKKSEELMELSDSRPAGIQIFGSDPEVMAACLMRVEEKAPDFIDINMGCPAPKIVKNRSGSDLLRHPETAEAIVRAVVKSASLPVTVKMRTGWDEEHKNAAELAKRFEDAGAAVVTIHGRTRERMYAPPTDLRTIAEVKKALSIPVIGNGDIFSPEDAKRMYEETGCDLVMVGRGALGRPWIFTQISDYLSKGAYAPDPSGEERMRLMLLHAERICARYGEARGMCELRKHALWYTKGLRGSSRLRARFSTVSSMDELRLLTEEVCQLNG